MVSNYFSFQPDRGMYYRICGVMYITDLSLLIGNNSPCSDGSGFPLALLNGHLQYVRRHIAVIEICGVYLK